MATNRQYDDIVNHFKDKNFEHFAVLYNQFKGYPVETIMDELISIGWIKKRGEYYDATQKYSDFYNNLPESFLDKPYSYYKDKQKEIQKQEAYVSELQFEQLKSNVEKLKNDLKNFKPSNRRANIAIVISALAVAITVIVLFLKWKGILQ